MVHFDAKWHSSMYALAAQEGKTDEHKNVSAYLSRQHQLNEGDALPRGLTSRDRLGSGKLRCLCSGWWLTALSDIERH